MKKLLTLCLLLALLCALGLAARAEGNALDEYLQTNYLKSGWTVETESGWVSARAVVVKENASEQRVLCLANGDQITACQPFYGRLNAYMDTDDALFLSYQQSDTESVHMLCRYREGAWRLSAVSATQEEPWNRETLEGPLVTGERQSILDGEWLLREYHLSDENDNLLASKSLPPLPNVLEDSALRLENIQWDQLPIKASGYDLWLYDAEETALVGRIYDKVVSNGYTYVEGRVFDDTLQFLADRSDGQRVILCGSYDSAQQAWQFVESAPLPAGTILGVENLVNSYGLGGGTNAVNVGRFANGKWGVTYYYGYQDGGDMSVFGPNTIGEGGYYWNANAAVGDHPWNDITKIDWNSLPSTLSEARKQVNPARWATPNNPNPEDRLNLRERPDKKSGSLGKFYNGTPLEVLEKGKEWTRVRIGAREGYMMTRYLAFGRDMANVNVNLTGKFARYALCAVRWDDNAQEEYLDVGDADLLLIIGQPDDAWYFVWDYTTNRFGRVRQTDVWDGNG